MSLKGGNLQIDMIDTRLFGNLTRVVTVDVQFSHHTAARTVHHPPCIHAEHTVYVLKEVGQCVSICQNETYLGKVCQLRVQHEHVRHVLMEHALQILARVQRHFSVRGVQGIEALLFYHVLQ